jgi:hypothetical protein
MTGGTIFPQILTDFMTPRPSYVKWQKRGSDKATNYKIETATFENF